MSARLVRTVVPATLAGALLARGVGGYALNRGSTEGFRKWNSALYSPLRLGLAALAGTVAVSATRRACGRG
ncbi:hypothetical protein GCM10010329_31820 [Streptomyces spiroverticillatus]|uniref:DUF3995 domain-containing protein n=1 Tax=Streptomyces finlayi TaxID=67296 RepID=A0A918WWJ2_9ACTN|nr:DUF3995 domain-containing protein [Streptomyces finlayi]GHA06867.1 hypothetical protein GCM10010329_31820 [Streptomyces spiroverticillatus]GHC90325.1 hypothetical protein GCM10010334_24230 [Streptomyces finlayi]